MPRRYAALQRCARARGRGAPAVLAALVPPREETQLCPTSPPPLTLTRRPLESLSKIIKIPICPFLEHTGIEGLINHMISPDRDRRDE